jgi:hypothetical protein
MGDTLEEEVCRFRAHGCSAGRMQCAQRGQSLSDRYGDNHSAASLGEAQTTKNGGSVTVFEHRKNVEKQDPNQEAIDVRVCAPAAPPTVGADAPYVTNQPWALLDADDRRYTSASTTWQHEGAQPAYPFEETIAWGDCVRGWVIIQGQTATQMTKVRYTGANSILEWKLP